MTLTIIGAWDSEILFAALHPHEGGNFLFLIIRLMVDPESVRVNCSGAANRGEKKGAPSATETPSC
jgi:hypothetical protein